MLNDKARGAAAPPPVQPIGLRHPFCFYYGHVAAFAKLRLLPQVSWLRCCLLQLAVRHASRHSRLYQGSRALLPPLPPLHAVRAVQEPASELDGVLSRGVDPSVLDPDQCHSHPAVPPAWPSQRQLERYVGELRRRLTAAMQQGVRCGRTLDGAEGEDGAGGAVPMHALCMVLEHERMHQVGPLFRGSKRDRAVLGTGMLHRPDLCAARRRPCATCWHSSARQTPLASGLQC
jgi:hypothetical protein